MLTSALIRSLIDILLENGDLPVFIEIKDGSDEEELTDYTLNVYGTEEIKYPDGTLRCTFPKRLTIG